jgi:hypothetical protein
MFLGAITFPVDAPSYTLRFNSQTETKITASGIINFSSNAQTIHLESSIQDDPTQNGDAATLTFINTANAGNADYYPNFPNVLTKFIGRRFFWTFFGRKSCRDGEAAWVRRVFFCQRRVVEKSPGNRR